MSTNFGKNIKTRVKKLHIDTTHSTLSKRLSELKQIRDSAIKEINACPPGNLRIMKQEKNVQSYRYETPLKFNLKGGASTRSNHPKAITFHLDFTYPNKRTRQEFIWEHFGLMDDPDYAKNALKKERIFATASFIQGVNFIATNETADHPLNTNYVEQIVHSLLI